MSERKDAVMTVEELQRFIGNYPPNTPVYMQVQLNDETITYPVEDIASDKDEAQCILLCGDEVDMIDLEG